MERYERNILINDFGREGQERLLNAKVLVVGAGGLGSPVLLYLAAAGVGTLGIIDTDKVDITNLQRQIIHSTNDLDRYKTESAKEKLSALNPECTIHTYSERFGKENAHRLIAGYDMVVDCCDNYETKFLINDVCVDATKPYVHGAVLTMRGEVMTYVPGHACYRCVFTAIPEEGKIVTSAQVGILGAVAGIIGSLQATEVIKYITGMGSLLTDSLYIFDGCSVSGTRLSVKKSVDCGCR